MKMAAEGAPSIMHVVLEPRYSGAEMLVRDLSRVQTAAGHRISITAFRPSQDNFKDELNALERDGCELFVPAQNLEKWGRLRWVWAAVKKAQPDVVFAHSILPAIYTSLALRLTRRPAVVTVLHTDDDLADPSLLRLERLVYQRNACVVGVSPKSVENFQRRMGGRVPIQVVRNGIKTEHFSQLGKNHRAWREEVYRPEGEEIIALQVGRISLQKQQHVSVEALVRLRMKGIGNIRLVLAGICEDAEYQKRLVHCAREGGVENQVQFAGPRGNIGEMLAGADLYLMPSAWEAHSVAALEALASGVFCIFSSIEAFADLGSYPGVAMIGAPPSSEDLGDCLERLVSSKNTERRYERDLEPFSIERCAAEYRDICEECIGRGSRSGAHTDSRQG